jgi:hypothetical protein
LKECDMSWLIDSMMFITAWFQCGGHGRSIWKNRLIADHGLNTVFAAISLFACQLVVLE